MKFEVDFGKMVQRNLKTKFERAVRMYVRMKEDEEDVEMEEEGGEDKSTDGNRWHSWQWQEENSGRWISYSPQTTIDLESGYQLYMRKSGKVQISFSCGENRSPASQLD